MKKAASKQISQETFDEVVKENIEDFDMSLEDATRDAVAQFESQGVDLSNIIKRLGGDGAAHGDADDARAAVRSAEEQLKRLKDMIAVLKAASEPSEVAEKLDELAAMVDQTPEMKVIAGRNDAIDSLVAHVGSSSDAVVEKACVLLVVLCTDNTDNQDFVGKSGLEQLALALAQDPDQRATATVARLLNAVRVVCAKHETNKAHFSKAKGVDAVCLYLQRAKTDDVLSKVVAAVLRVVTINDDPKATFSQAQDTIKLLVANDLIPYIIEVVQARRDQPEFLSVWLAVLKQLAITEEHCKKIYDLAGLDLLFQIMLQYERNLTVVKRCVTVFRNVAAADDIKMYIITSGGAEQILAAMQTHLGDASMQQHACATLAAIALRSPENSTRIVDIGAARMIAFAMRTHKGDTALLRQASLAIRNMVARAPELRARILEEDVEELLRDAQQYRGCGDEAYAALRDLGCDIKLSSFGTGTQPLAQFNPVNIESVKLLDSVDEAAEAPFAHHA